VPDLGGDRSVFCCPSQDPRCEWTSDGEATGLVATDEYVRFGYEPGEPLLNARCNRLLTSDPFFLFEEVPYEP